MIYPETSTAFAFADWKGAALYFDDVLCTSSPDDEILNDHQLECDVVEAINTRHPKIRWMHRVMSDDLGARHFWEYPVIDPSIHQREFEIYVRTAADWARSSNEWKKDGVSLWGAPLSPAEASKDSDVALVLAELQLIDVARIGWRQILEIRKDKTAINQLRNLRRTVYKDYTGKPQAYIRDDIEARIDDYRRVTKVWNFPLNKGILEIAMTGEALTAIGAAVSLACFGAPIAAAAAAGGSIAIGKAVLAIANRRREVRLEELRNPMAYLVRLEHAAGSQSSVESSSINRGPDP